MKKGELDGFLWSCRSCKSTFPSLENISSCLKEIQTKHEVRMSSLEERVSKIETVSSDEINSRINSMKEEVLSSLTGEITNIVDKRNKEVEERKRREANILVFNLPENESSTGSENKKADEDRIQEICSKLGLENIQFVTTFRLGKKLPQKPRPIKVILQNKAHKKFLLDNARNIPTKAPNFNRVIFTKDLTPQQREERRDYINKKKTRRNEQTQHFSGIRGHQEHRDHQTDFPISMESDQPLPSPILSTGNLSSHLSQENTFSETQRALNFNEYSNSTIRDQTLDKTVIEAHSYSGPYNNYNNSTLLDQTSEKTVRGSQVNSVNVQEPVSPTITDR